jgi:hypothetical protein
MPSPLGPAFTPPQPSVPPYPPVENDKLVAVFKMMERLPFPAQLTIANALARCNPNAVDTDVFGRWCDKHSAEIIATHPASFPQK